MSNGCYRFENTIIALHGLFRTHAVPTPYVIFVRQREEAEEVAAELLITWVHAGLSDVERAAVAAAMRDGTCHAVVCTDVWATGVDIPNIAAVLLACGGSAPIGLKQRSGRGTRLFNAKTEFLIFDVEVRPGDPHRERRLQHYADGGYEVVGHRARPPSGEMPPAVVDEDLEQLMVRGQDGGRTAASRKQLTPDERQAQVAASYRMHVPTTERGRRIWSFIMNDLMLLLALALILLAIARGVAEHK
jgi:superfamily II DNA or RNA helicase